MSPGSHATDDGSFARSAGIQAGRAAVLIGLALLVGLILLHRSPGAAPTPVAIGDSSTTRSSRPSASTTTTKKATGTTTRPAGTTTTTVPLRSAQDIKVLVANGTSTPGLAGSVSNTLHTKGYDTLASTNATTKPTGSLVFFQPGYGADAASLATKLNLPAGAVQAMPSPPPVSSLNSADILVVAGPDLANAVATTSTT